MNKYKDMTRLICFILSCAYITAVAQSTKKTKLSIGTIQLIKTLNWLLPHAEPHLAVNPTDGKLIKRALIADRHFLIFSKYSD
jgi:hypothetical protein